MTARLLGLVYQDSDEFDALMRELVDHWRAEGLAIGGLLQRAEGDQTFVTRIDDGRTLGLMQDLGLCAEGCRLDPHRLTEAAGWLDEMIAQRPDLLLISRFGRFEAEGGGYLAEIGAAAAADQPSLIGVSPKYVTAWRDFVGDCAETRDASREAALSWRRALAS